MHVGWPRYRDDFVQYRCVQGGHITGVILCGTDAWRVRHNTGVILCGIDACN